MKKKILFIWVAALSVLAVAEPIAAQVNPFLGTWTAALSEGPAQFVFDGSTATMTYAGRTQTWSYTYNGNTATLKNAIGVHTDTAAVSGNTMTTRGVGGGASYTFTRQSSGGGNNVSGEWIGTMPRSAFATIVASELGLTQREAERRLVQLNLPSAVPIMKMVFAADGTYSMYELEPFEGTQSYLDSGSYTVSGNTITADGEQITVRGNSFTLRTESGTLTFRKQ
jgi:hypothetical protein